MGEFLFSCFFIKKAPECAGFLLKLEWYGFSFFKKSCSVCSLQLRFSCRSSLAMGSTARCLGPAAIAMLVHWLSLPLLEMKKELPYPRLPQHTSGKKRCLPQESPWLRDMPALRAQETLGQAVGEQGSGVQETS